MKLYDIQLAPHPRRVRIFLAEKGIEVETIEVDVNAGENLTPEFLAKNPFGKMPVLELDDGRCLSESLAICEYFEDVQPDPPLIGATPDDRSEVRMWNTRVECELAKPMISAFENTSAYFEGRVQQVPEYAEICREQTREHFGWLDGYMNGRDFVCLDRFTLADITLWCFLDFGEMIGEGYDADTHPNVRTWHRSIQQRPSASA